MNNCKSKANKGSKTRELRFLKFLLNPINCWLFVVVFSLHIGSMCAYTCGLTANQYANGIPVILFSSMWISLHLR